MVDFVEVFWNAAPSLQRLGIRVNAGSLDPRAERLFEEVRAAARDAYPDAVPLVRIAVRSKKGSTEELRVMRSGQPDEAGVKRLHAALERAVAEIEGAASDGELLPA